MKTVEKLALRTRFHRKIHRWLAPVLVAFLLVISVSGLMLGWKKHSGGYLLADSRQGQSTDLASWLPLDSLSKLAIQALRDSIDPDLSPAIDRIDVRPEKGMVKFTFQHHFRAVQLDGTTGAVLHLEHRRADWIEKLHDGSLLDYYAGTGGGQFKLLYVTLVGTGLFTLALTGFWLWINPRRMRKKKQGRIG